MWRIMRFTKHGDERFGTVHDGDAAGFRFLGYPIEA